ncbi:MAG: hypothetical protein OXC91_11540 [Rhodobacteraceae bacterium]|nr:hypothetical protein [Paracoccaceae bacterium]
MKHLNKRSDDITRLEIGWDGYGGRLVSCTNAVFAACLIERLYTPGVPAPQIVPGSDGTLQIEWHRRGLSVELDVLKPFQVVATKIIQGNGEAEEHMLGCEFSLVADWIDQLKQLSDAREYSGDATLR